MATYCNGHQSYKSKYPQGQRDLDETWHRDSLWKGLKNGYIINPRIDTHRAQDLLECQKSGKKAVFDYFQGRGKFFSFLDYLGYEEQLFLK